MAKLGKKLSKNRNSTNFNTTKDRPKFLTPNAKTAFNCLRLSFTKAPILQYFDLKCYIQIENDALSFAIDGVLNQLISKTNPNRIITKTNLG